MAAAGTPKEFSSRPFTGAKTAAHFRSKSTREAQPSAVCALWISVIRDITERKQAEEELRLTQADLARAQAVALTGSWRLDVRRNELLWSDETYRMFGIPRNALTYEIFSPAYTRMTVNSWTGRVRGPPGPPALRYRAPHPGG